RAEDDGSDHDADRLDEGVPKRLHLRAEVGVKLTQRDTDRHGDEHIKPKLQKPWLVFAFDGGRCRLSHGRGALLLWYDSGHIDFQQHSLDCNPADTEKCIDG